MSSDGFVCRGTEDRMRWTGAADKELFKAHTMGQVVGAGSNTWRLMRNLKLPGRRLVRITREPTGIDEETLGDFARIHPDGWLIGGQETLLAGLREGLMREVILSHVDGVDLGAGVCDHVTLELAQMAWQVRLERRDGLTVAFWQKKPHR